MNKTFKVGIGYDVHRLAEKESFILGGINIPFNKGLVGHSDGDVLLHSIIDAILGAINKGNIGDYFPSSDQKNKNLDSQIMLKYVNKILKRENYSIVNIDSTIILEEPRLSPHVNKIQSNISKILEINFNQVSIKPKTNDKLGFLGQSLGVCAQTIVLINKC